MCGQDIGRRFPVAWSMFATQLHTTGAPNCILNAHATEPCHASGWSGIEWRNQRINSTTIREELQLHQQARSHLPPSGGLRAQQPSPNPERRRENSPDETIPRWDTSETEREMRTTSSRSRQAYSMTLHTPSKPSCGVTLNLIWSGWLGHRDRGAGRVLGPHLKTFGPHK